MAQALRGPVARLRRRFAFDAIDSYYLYPDGVAAAILARAFDVPFVLSALGTDVSLIPDWMPSRRMILNAVNRSAATTAVCRALTDRLAALGAGPSKLHVVEHGVDLDLFRSPADRAATRAYAERYEWAETGRQHRALLAAAVAGHRLRSER